MFSLEDVLLVWNDHPNYIFSKALIGPRDTFVFKFSSCFHTKVLQLYESNFWTIHSVVSSGLSKPAGFIFNARGKVVRYTAKAISSCNEGNSKDFIESLTKTNPWSMRGLDLIKYEEAGEVITDLCAIMGVDVTIDA